MEQQETKVSFERDLQGTISEYTVEGSFDVETTKSYANTVTEAISKLYIDDQVVRNAKFDTQHLHKFRSRLENAQEAIRQLITSQHVLQRNDVCNVALIDKIDKGETDHPLDSEPNKPLARSNFQRIVIPILSEGNKRILRSLNAASFGDFHRNLARLRYIWKFHRYHGEPLVFVGGTPKIDFCPELMLDKSNFVSCEYLFGPPQFFIRLNQTNKPCKSGGNLTLEFPQKIPSYIFRLYRKGALVEQCTIDMINKKRNSDETKQAHQLRNARWSLFIHRIIGRLKAEKSVSFKTYPLIQDPAEILINIGDEQYITISEKDECQSTENTESDSFSRSTILRLIIRHWQQILPCNNSGRNLPSTAQIQPSEMKRISGIACKTADAEQSISTALLADAPLTKSIIVDANHLSLHDKVCAVFEKVAFLSSNVTVVSHLCFTSFQERRLSLVDKRKIAYRLNIFSLNFESMLSQRLIVGIEDDEIFVEIPGQKVSLGNDVKALETTLKRTMLDYVTNLICRIGTTMNYNARQSLSLNFSDEGVEKIITLTQESIDKTTYVHVFSDLTLVLFKEFEPTVQQYVNLEEHSFSGDHQVQAVFNYLAFS